MDSYISKLLAYYISGYEHLLVPLQYAIEIAIFLVFIYAIHKLTKYFFTRVIQNVVSKTSFEWDNILHKNKVFLSFTYLTPIILFYFLAPYFISDFSKISKPIFNFYQIGFVIIVILFLTRLLNGLTDIATYNNNHRTVAVRSFTQLFKLLLFLTGFLISISLLLDTSISKILTGLGAITAIILLIFKDTILGFVSGLHVGSSKMIHVGDWIEVPKHDVEGVIKEINLISAKIENFDKTYTTIPTYDLISSAVKNHNFMSKTNTRRIKKSIPFSISSFRFLTTEDIQKYKQNERVATIINTIIESDKKDLTNIKLFRLYTESYINNHPQISQKDTKIIRQLEPNEKGMNLEIYCFTNTAIWEEFENIQSDIMDHLLTISKEFELKITQFTL